MGFSLAMVVRPCRGDNGGDAKMADVSSTSRRTFSSSWDIVCARNAVKYRPAARKTVVNENTPAAENKPSRIIRQVGLGLFQFLR
jgi:hypothetical protein